MEFDRPKINQRRSQAEILESLKKRLSGSDCGQMVRIESALCDVLSMMWEKTRQYGGNKDQDKSFEYRAWKAMLDGVERKSNRLEQLTVNSVNGDQNSKDALLDTYIDVIGYGLLAIVAIGEDLVERKDEN